MDVLLLRVQAYSTCRARVMTRTELAAKGQIEVANERIAILKIRIENGIQLLMKDLQAALSDPSTEGSVQVELDVDRQVDPTGHDTLRTDRIDDVVQNQKICVATVDVNQFSG